MKLPKGAIKIYDAVEKIFAIKGNDSLWPGKFVHKFKVSNRIAVYGLPDGSLLLKSQVGKRLHKKFDYPDR